MIDIINEKAKRANRRRAARSARNPVVRWDKGLFKPTETGRTIGPVDPEARSFMRRMVHHVDRMAARIWLAQEVFVQGIHDGIIEAVTPISTLAEDICEDVFNEPTEEPSEDWMPKRARHSVAVHVTASRLSFRGRRKGKLVIVPA